MRIGAAKSCRGMTIIETVIALFVFAVSVTGACAVVVKAREVAETSRLHYTAVNLARNRIEQARSFDFKDLAFLRESATVVGVKGSPDVNGDFRRSTSVTNVSAHLAMVTVTVEIKNRYTTRFDGKTQQVSTYLANYQAPPTP